MNHLNKDTLLEALAVALQHPALAADQQNVCRLLQTCKAWRKALHQSSACVTDVSFKQVIDSEAGYLVAQLAADLARFSHWVSAYAGGIRSIKLDITAKTSDSTGTAGEFKALAQHVLALGLRAPAATQATPTAAVASSVPHGGATPDATLLQPLRLQSFQCSRDLTSPLVLSALPAATLTRLDIAVPEIVQVHEQLGRLRNLRSLTITHPRNFLALDHLGGISKLGELTHLSLSMTDSLEVLQLLPRQLRELNLEIMYTAQGSVDMSDFSQLQHLSAFFVCPNAALILPQQLQVLDISRCLTAVACSITSLQQLQDLKIGNSGDTIQDLLSLRRLSQLKSIELRYTGMVCALDAAPAWSQLQQLSALHLQVSGNAVQMDAVMKAIRLLSSIKTLHLDLRFITIDEAVPEDMIAIEEMRRICQVPLQLTQLRDLRLGLRDWVRLEKDDLLHFKNFTGLTSLRLQLDELDDMNLIAVLLATTRLQHLAVGTLKEPYTLPVIGRLYELTGLSVFGLSEQQQGDSLKYLTGLRNLRELHGFESCNRTSIQQFWQSVCA